MTKREKYVRARLEGLSPSEAGEVAGYESNPPGDAVDLADKAEMLQKMEPGGSIEQWRKDLRDKKMTVRALEIVRDI